jgi:glycosyltransferase involved in cell wall biosynthesis
LRKCLEAVHHLIPAANEILVVDNTPGDKETELVAREFASRCICEPIPGLSRARNRALNECGSDIVAFLDDDATPSKNWLHHILRPFDDPMVASVTGDTFPQENAADKIPDPPRSLSKKDPQWFEIATFGGLGVGTNMALRRVFCMGWKVFDERLGRGAPLWIAEESHAFAVLLARGYRAVHVPAAVVIHPMKPRDIELEASTSFAYWLLLFCEFPGHRLDLLQFLLRRLRRKKLTWPRDPQGPGEIINSGWRMYLKAGWAGTMLYLRTRKLKEK